MFAAAGQRTAVARAEQAERLLVTWSRCRRTPVEPCSGVAIEAAALALSHRVTVFARRRLGSSPPAWSP